MSGIAGLYTLDGLAVHATAISKMLQSMPHRAANGRRTRVTGSLGLGAFPRRTSDEHETTSSRAVWDGRLDNRDQLAAGLGCPRDTDETELIQRAYEKWGRNCPRHVEGDFAFAVWDERKRQLFCARDRFGARPFFFRHVEGRSFAFGSEIKSLLALDRRTRLNLDKVALHLLGRADTEQTFHREIRRLPPAHSATISADGVRLQRYWELDPDRELRLPSIRDYAEQYRETLLAAVRRRLPGDGRTGCQLSGGLDSSSIAWLARELTSSRRSLPTLSLLFADFPTVDERSHIEAVLSARTGFRPHFIEGGRTSPLVELKRVFHHREQPFGPNAFLPWLLYDKAQRLGLRALLNGFDGDAVVGHGHALLGELARRGRWTRLFAEVQSLARRQNKTRWGVFRRSVLPRIVAPRLWTVARMTKLATSGSLLNRRLAKRVGVPLIAPNRLLRLDPRLDHFRVLMDPIFVELLEADAQTAAAFGIEPGCPFFDRELVEFCLAVPVEHKLHDGWTRYIVRAALAGSLPESIRWRADKSSLAPVVNRRLIDHERDTLRRVMAEIDRIADFVDVEFLRREYRRYLGSGGKRSCIHVWRATILSLWLQETGLTAH